MDEVIADRMLLEQLFARLRELDPEADTIIQLWQDHPEGISDRAIARELGRPQKTFADQMKKYRTDLRRITVDK
jgi:IS30 family transposase